VLDDVAIPSGAGGGVLIANDFADDAAVVEIGDGDLATVLTADVIAPIVDDPETFGRIAATNSISDVYAMGGRPLYALNLVFFPDDVLGLEVLAAMLRGGAAAAAEVGVAVVGGHTVRDDQVKYGMSVTGVVGRDQVLSNRGARAGQALVLTKALGTGVIGTAIKGGEASEHEIEAAVASMTAHNASALEIARRHRVTAATDVTGFGLLGHLRNILRGSGLAARLAMAALPLLPGARAHAVAGRVPGGSRANLRFVAPRLEVRGEADEILTLLAADAQTSGGLLLCCDAERAADLVAELVAAGLAAAEIGALLEPTPRGGGRPVETTILDFEA
jgi:selenide,water dikinase